MRIPRILTTVSDLEEISTAAISISLLNYVLVPRRNFILNGKDVLVSRIMQSANKLPLPKVPIKLIEKNVRKICEGIKDWIDYHYDLIFQPNRRIAPLGSSWYDCLRLVSDFVWYPNGGINYKQTALHLQSSSRLTDVQKFRLLCKYCLKEKIEQKWPALPKNDFVRTSIRGYYHYYDDYYLLFQYWDSYCRNTLNDISVPDGMSLDSYMFQNKEVDNWTAKEYFFDRINVDEKLQNAISMIDKGTLIFQKEMLMKLNETQRLQVYVERPGQVLYNFIVYDSAEDATSAWFEIRDLINPEQFVMIIRELCKSPDDSFALDVWRCASNEMKLCLLSSDNDPYFKMFWDRCIRRPYDIEKYKKLFDTNKDIKKALREKDFFIQNCSELIAKQELSQLKTLLNFCFPNNEELTRFKHHHIHQSVWFREHCEYLAKQEIPQLKSLLNFCFPNNEELTRFIHDHIHQNVWFREHCEYLTKQELPQLKSLLNFCFPNNEELTRFKHHHIHQSVWFRKHCKDLVLAYWYVPLEDLTRLIDFCFCNREEFIQFGKEFTNQRWFSDRCQELIKLNNMSRLNRVINAFLPKAEDRYQFKKGIINQSWFSEHCKSLIREEKSSLLNEMLNLLLPRTEAEDLFQFKQAFAEKVYIMSFLETSILTNQKLRCTSAAHLLQELNDPLPYPADKLARLKICITREDFFLEHCHHLILNKNLDDLQKEFEFFFDTLQQSASFRLRLINSPSFFDYCLNIVFNYDFSLSNLETLMDLITFDSTTVISLPTVRSIDQLKTTTIFSPQCIILLREFVENNCFNEVEKLFNKLPFLEKDKNVLRSTLFWKPDKLIKKFFFEYDESACKSWMEWWFSDKDSLQKCKRKLSVDSIFEEEFKKCVFQTYDESGRVSHCTLNKDFEFGALDRFLKWRFGSEKEVKEYKLRRINEYESIETINVLVKKECHVSNFKKLTAFFFENDSEKIAKFKKKHEGERIAEMLKRI